MAWKRWAILALILVVNGLLLIARYRSGPGVAASSDPGYAKMDETYRKHARGLAERAEFERKYAPSHSLIGDLTLLRSWVDVLALSSGQKDAITKVNDLVNETRYRTMLAQAAGYHGDPAQYQKYLDRSNERQMAAYRHAASLVRTGLLSEEQADLVIQRTLEPSGRANLYGNTEFTAESLGLSATQKERLAEMGEEANNQGNALAPLAFSSSPDDAKLLEATNQEIRQGHEAAAWAVLTPEQKGRWSRITAKRPALTEPPDLPIPGVMQADAERAELLKISATFRALSDGGDELKISAEQKQLVDKLIEVVALGLFWLDHRGNGDTPGRDGGAEGGAGRSSRRRSEFVEHAEQFASLGILTKDQTGRLQAADIKPSSTPPAQFR